MGLLNGRACSAVLTAEAFGSENNETALMVADGPGGSIWLDFKNDVDPGHSISVGGQEPSSVRDDICPQFVGA